MTDVRYAKPLFSALAVGAALATLGACGPVNRGLSSVHQPVVTTRAEALDLPAGRLGPDDRARAAAWLDALRPTYGDRLWIEDPAGFYAAIPDLAPIVARHGLALGPSRAEGAPGTVRLIVERAAAAVKGCPDWRRASHPEFAGSTMSNHGCAVNANLAAMIADPRDLVAGKTGDLIDAQVTAKGVGAWRKAEPSGTRPLERVSTGGGSGQ